MKGGWKLSVLFMFGYPGENNIFLRYQKNWISRRGVSFCWKFEYESSV